MLSVQLQSAMWHHLERLACTGQPGMALCRFLPSARSSSSHLASLSSFQRRLPPRKQRLSAFSSTVGQLQSATSSSSSSAPSRSARQLIPAKKRGKAKSVASPSLVAPILSPAAVALVRYLRQQEGEEGVRDGLASFVRQKGSERDIMSAVAELRRQQQWEKVVQVLSWLLSEQVAHAPDVNFFNLLMDAYGKLRQPEKAQAIFDDLKAKYSCIPSAASFNVLINACGLGGQFDDARRAFEMMRAKGYPPGLVTFNAMIEIETAAGDVAAAERQWEEMRRLGIAPSVVSYTLMIDAYGKASMVEKAEAVFKSMHAARCLPSLAAFTALIAAFSRHGMCHEAEQAFENLQSFGFSPNVSTFNALMEAYSRAGNPAAAEEIFDTMPSSGVFPNLASFNILIDAYATLGSWQEAESIFARLQSARLKPSLQTHMLLLKAYALAGLSDNVSKSIVILKESGFNINARILNYELIALGEAGKLELMEKKFEEMKANGLADITTYNAIISVYSEGGFLERAEESFEEAREGERTITVETWTALTEGYAKRKLLRKCISLFSKMVDSGVAPDATMRKVMLAACRSKEQEVSVKKLLANPGRKGRLLM